MSVSKVLAIYTPDGGKPIKKRLRRVVQSYSQKDLDDVYDSVRSKFSECFSNSNFVIEIKGETILPRDTQKFGDSVKGLKELEIVIKNTVTKREIEQTIIDEKEGEADIDWEKVYNDLLKNINDEFKVLKFLLQNKDEIHVEGADDLKQEWEEMNDSGDSTLKLFLSYEETKEKKFNVTNGISLLFEFTPKRVNDSNEAVMKDTWKKNWNGLRGRVFEHLQLQNNEKLFLLSRMDERDDIIEDADELSDYFNELLNDDNSEAFQLIVICFIFEYNGHYVSWIPSDSPLSTEIEIYDWRNAFKEMKQFVSKQFQLETEDLTFQNAQDESDIIDNERDIKYIWEEMLNQDCLGIFRIVIKNLDSDSDSDSSLNESIKKSNAKVKKKKSLEEEMKYENKGNNNEQRCEASKKPSVGITEKITKVQQSQNSESVQNVDSNKTVKSSIQIMTDIGNKLSQLNTNNKENCKGFMNIVVDTLLHIKPDEDRDILYSTWGFILKELENNTDGKESIEVVREFLGLLDFTLTKNAKDYLITGQPNIDIIKFVKQNFDVLEGGVIIEDNGNSLEQCLHGLEIEIPKNDNEVKHHKNGIYDKHHIIFTLQEIKLEDQDLALVNKCILQPEYMSRFINYFVFNSCRDDAKIIDFHRLENIQIIPISFFGSEIEVVELLMRFGILSTALKTKMLAEKNCLPPGIHALLPLEQLVSLPSIYVVLFYWPVKNAFAKDNIKRSNISCLFSRVLQEVSTTLCIPITKQDLTDFGTVEEIKQEPVRSGVIFDFRIKEDKANSVSISNQLIDNINLKMVKSSIYSNLNAESLDKHPENLFVLGGTDTFGYSLSFKCGSRTEMCQHNTNFQSKKELYTFLQQTSSSYCISYQQNLCFEGKIELASALNEDIVRVYKDSQHTIQLQYEEDEKNITTKADDQLAQNQELVKKTFFLIYLDKLESVFFWFFVLFICFENLLNCKWQLKRHPLFFNLLHWIDVKDLTTDQHCSIDIALQNKQEISDVNVGYAEKSAYYLKNLPADMERILKNYQSKKKEKAGKEGGNWIIAGIKQILSGSDKKIDTHDRTNQNSTEKNDEKTTDDVKTINNTETTNDIVAVPIEVLEEIDWTLELGLLQRWYAKYQHYYNEYSKNKKICLDRYKIIENIQKDVKQKFDKDKGHAKKEFEKNFSKFLDEKKGSSTLKMKISGITVEEKANYETFKLAYYLETELPPSNELKFVSFAQTNENVDSRFYENMAYEIQQDQHLLCHALLKNKEMMLIIRTTFHDSQCSTKVIMSKQKILSSNTKPVTKFGKTVDFVAFNGRDETLAVYAEDSIAFFCFQNNYATLRQQQSPRINLTQFSWYEKTKVQNILFEDNTKQLLVIDKNNWVRFFDLLNNGIVMRGKEFQITDKNKEHIDIQHFLLTPEGGYLLAFSQEMEEVQAEQIANILIPQGETLVDGEEDTKEIEATTATSEEPGEQKQESIQTEIDKKVKGEKRKPTGKIVMDCWLLAKKEKIVSLILPDSMTIDTIDMKQIQIKQNKDKKSFLVGTNKFLQLCMLELVIEVAQAHLHSSVQKMDKQDQEHCIRKETKLDYLEYHFEKFGSRPEFHDLGQDGKLTFHTTLFMDEAQCKTTEEKKKLECLCSQIPSNVTNIIQSSSKKDFTYLNWECSLAWMSKSKELLLSHVIDEVTDKIPHIKLSDFVKLLIIQVPIQIARGSNNSFMLMYNGEDNQREYINTRSVFQLRKEIRFGAYDALINSWEKDIKVVTSMGKQSTGKSYKLNHLFGTKFDISGGRCTDGTWLSVRIVKDILYVLLDFEGLGSFERTQQEDVLLSVFNAAMSNCTIFKCENRFDQDVGGMFQKFQKGVDFIKGSEKCFQGRLLLVIKDIIKSGEQQAIEDFVRHIRDLCHESKVQTDGETMESNSFLTKMYKGSLRIEAYPPLANEGFFRKLALFRKDVDDIPAMHRGGQQFLSHMKLIMSKLSVQDWGSLSGEMAKMRVDELKDYIDAAIKAGTCTISESQEGGAIFRVAEDNHLIILDGSKPVLIENEVALKKAIEKAAERNADIIQILEKEKLEEKLLAALGNVNDGGLILGSIPSQKYLWEKFESMVMKRDHDNFGVGVFVFQLWLDTIHVRREMRVLQWIEGNTCNFKSKDEQDVINSFLRECQVKLRQLREPMVICKQKCKQCNYPCLLHKGHEEDKKYLQHDCWNENNSHQCVYLCYYCQNDKKDEAKDAIPCGYPCGHEGKHDCQVRNHCCGQPCSLAHLDHCQQHCALESGHDSSIDHMCVAKIHYCSQPCSLPGCKMKCVEDHIVSHDRHWCGEKRCPHKCQVQCRTKTDTIELCGAQCHSEDHFHHLKIESDEIGDEGHTCHSDHLCPEKCHEQGICEIITERKFEARDYEGQRGTFKYDAVVEVNAKRKYCVVPIPKFHFRHSINTKDHICYTQHVCDYNCNCKHVARDLSHICDDTCGCTHIGKKHSCDVKCPSCGYFCDRPYGHTE
ncbi:hypothetical protein RFI_30937, partial [Reticulomyxa filosa]